MDSAFVKQGSLAARAVLFAERNRWGLKKQPPLFKSRWGYQRASCLAFQSPVPTRDDVGSRPSGDVPMACKSLRIWAISSFRASAWVTYSAIWFKLRVLRPTKILLALRTPPNCLA